LKKGGKIGLYSIVVGTTPGQVGTGRVKPEREKVLYEETGRGKGYYGTLVM